MNEIELIHAGLSRVRERIFEKTRRGYELQMIRSMTEIPQSWTGGTGMPKGKHGCCPFCGSKRLEPWRNTYGLREKPQYRCAIYCKSCQCEGPAAVSYNKATAEQEATDLWRRRNRRNA